ncbi:alpha/beta fold hydrolase [Adlercreutzia sp. ZJ138]|uniref:alpha/beta fold hydrolase n=1 Tax=Adlercreutzia sp. ZJ138 TaxID=2709405 RepID=UPI0013EC1BED|nr:alpha/beta hydrolase [Adlercreutzia sp. ZJ138]
MGCCGVCGNETKLSYTVYGSNKPPLVLVHAQGTNSRSFDKVIKPLSRDFSIYAVDCFGHGKSPHEPSLYNIVAIGDALVRLIESVVGEPCTLLGHSSGGLIAAYAAGKTDLCELLILEDPPFFSSQAERRNNTFNYIDLSSVCHKYLQDAVEENFVLYYFENQYAWNFFPDNARQKVRPKSIESAKKFLKRHPERDLKVPFWPKSALAAFVGMGNYDPHFGETFYDDSFHCGIPHEEILTKIDCPTLFMKAKTEWSDDGILFAALSEEDLTRCLGLISDCELARFDCGHGIHVEQPRQFVQVIKRKRATLGHARI